MEGGWGASEYPPFIPPLHYCRGGRRGSCSAKYLIESPLPFTLEVKLEVRIQTNGSYTIVSKERTVSVVMVDLGTFTDVCKVFFILCIVETGV